MVGKHKHGMFVPRFAMSTPSATYAAQTTGAASCFGAPLGITFSGETNYERNVGRRQNVDSLGTGPSLWFGKQTAETDTGKQEAKAILAFACRRREQANVPAPAVMLRSTSHSHLHSVTVVRFLRL